MGPIYHAKFGRNWHTEISAEAPKIENLVTAAML